MSTPPAPGAPPPGKVEIPDLDDDLSLDDLPDIAPDETDALLDEIAPEQRPPPADFSDGTGAEVWGKMSEAFPDDEALAEAVGPNIVQQLGSGSDLRTNIAYAGLAASQLLSPQLFKQLDAAGVLDSDEMLLLAARLGRQLVPGTTIMRDPMTSNAPAERAPARGAERQKIDAAIQRIFDQHAGKSSMNSDHVQSQLRRLFRAKTGSGPYSPGGLPSR